MYCWVSLHYRKPFVESRLQTAEFSFYERRYPVPSHNHLTRKVQLLQHLPRRAKRSLHPRADVRELSIELLSPKHHTDLHNQYYYINIHVLPVTPRKHLS